MTFVINVPTFDGNEEIPIEAGSSVVVVGANGTGKTRLATYIENSLNLNAHRISAHRALSLNPAVPKIGENMGLLGRAVMLATSLPSWDYDRYGLCQIVPHSSISISLLATHRDLISLLEKSPFLNFCLDSGRFKNSMRSFNISSGTSIRSGILDLLQRSSFSEWHSSSGRQGWRLFHTRPGEDRLAGPSPTPTITSPFSLRKHKATVAEPASP